MSPLYQYLLIPLQMCWFSVLSSRINRILRPKNQSRKIEINRDEIRVVQRIPNRNGCRELRILHVGRETIECRFSELAAALAVTICTKNSTGYYCYCETLLLISSSKTLGVSEVLAQSAVELYKYKHFEEYQLFRLRGKLDHSVQIGTAVPHTMRPRGFFSS